MLICDECGAMMNDAFVSTHRDWHQQIAAQIAEAVAVAIEARDMVNPSERVAEHTGLEELRKPPEIKVAFGQSMLDRFGPGVLNGMED